MKCHCLFFLSFFCIQLSFSQQIKYSGKVIDAITSEPIAFAGIIINSDIKKVVLTNIDGNFSIKSNIQVQSLTVNSVGYKRLTIQTVELKNYIIKLEKDTVSISEVKVYPKENPAHRIIKKAIENSIINNPDNIAQYSCRVYNKTVIDFIAGEKLMKDSAKYSKYKQFAEKSHGIISESFSKRYYKSPGSIRNIITAVKLSGFKNPKVSIQSTDYQPFHVYSDYITVLNMNFLNPISKGSISRYYFEIKDTLYSHSDSIFVISFRPRRNSNIEGLEGVLYINTHKYAIQTIKARPFGECLWNFSIEQQYQLHDDYWFPKELNYSLAITTPTVGQQYVGKCFIDSVNLNSNSISNIDFNEKTIEFTDSAANVSSEFWRLSRHDSLDIKDRKTYQMWDSLSRKHNLDKWMIAFNSFARLAIPIGVFDFDVTKFYRTNVFEGYRLGSSMHTNRTLSKHFVTGGYFAYGTKDKQLKYGADLGFRFGHDYFNRIQCSYTYDVLEPGAREQYFDETYDFFRGVFKNNMDRFRELRVSSNYKLDYIRFYFSAQKQRFDLYTKSNQDIFEASFSIRYCYKEKYSEMFDKEFSLGSDYPLIYIHYSRGFNDILNGRYSYNRIWGSINNSFLVRNVGESSYCLEIGYVESKAPYQKLFNGPGSNYNKYPFYGNNMFQTMSINEFASNRFVNLFFEHNFKTLILKTKYFSPDILIIQNVGFGKGFNNIRDYSKGFFESGILLNNIVKFNCENILYIGFGTGVFSRYGNYASSDFIKNSALKLNMTVTFKR